jgi:hypothetical protein
MTLMGHVGEDLTATPGGAVARTDARPLIRFLLVAALVLSFAPAFPHICPAEAAQPPDGEGSVPPPIAIWIIPETQSVVLDSERGLPTADGVPVLPALEGVAVFTVHSPLPEWGVAVEFDPLAGSGSDLNVWQVSVSSRETGGEFVPVAERPIVARGTGPQPAEGLSVRLQVRPAWTDVPGPCQGMLYLHPVPPIEQEPGTVEGTSVAIPVSMTIQGLTAVVMTDVEFRISGGPGPGRYILEPDLGVIVASNEAEWKLRVEGTPFTSGQAEIPLERAEWARLEPDGEPHVWTALGDESVLMFGYGERGVFKATFRVALDVTPADRAGNYVCRLLLVGSPG